MTEIDFILNEQTILRNELQELKKCQIQYFLLSVTATGAILGFNKDLPSDMLYLTPMLIILPCWLTFFDKANTITRLTGYVRVFIEDQLNIKEPFYIGYENALAIFREQEKSFTPIKHKITVKEFFNLTRHQYWKINWVTFFALSITCLAFPVFKCKGLGFLVDEWSGLVYAAFFCLWLFCGFYSHRIYRRLINERYSYKNVADFWRKVVLPEAKSQLLQKSG